MTTVLTLQPGAADGIDTSVNSGGATYNYGVNVWLLNGSAYKGLIRFDLSSILASEQCLSAVLSLFMASNGAAQAFTLTAYAVAIGNAAWIEGTKNGAQAGAGEPCWNALAANGSGGVTTAWAGSAGLATAGTDYESGALGSASGNRSDANGTEYAISLSRARIQKMFGGATYNYGLLIVPSAGCGGIGSSDNATAAYRPKLVVAHYTPIPAVYSTLLGSQRNS